jgi:RNA polymerase sigma-70 factor (sigma-E family)
VSNEQAEFAEFFQASWEPCLRAVVTVVGSPSRAEDQVAEAFARAWASWRKVRVHPAPIAWVVRTALNTNVSWWRRRRGEVPLSSGVDWAAPSAGPGLDDGLVAAVAALPARQREVLVLRVFFDLDMATTASLLGIAPGTVGSHLHKALTALRTRMPSFREWESDNERR